MVASVSRREAAAEEWLLLFFLFSAAGWVWEVGLTACTRGQWVNRGMLRGPWLPVYGVGGVALAAVLGRLRRKWAVPLAGAALGGVIEYGAALTLEWRFRQRWWDYSGLPGSLQGRVCLASVGGFALAGWALVWAVPALRGRLSRVRPDVRTALCRGIGLLYALDWAWALIWPNEGAGVTMPL